MRSGKGTMRDRLACVLVLVLAVLLVGCATSGQGTKTAPATGTTTVGAQTVGRTQAGQTNVLMGGDVTYNVTTTGVPLDPELQAKLVAGLERFKDALDKAATEEGRQAVLAGMTRYAEAMSKAFGVNISITVGGEDGKGAGNAGAADAAGTAGESAIPPVKEPDLPKVPQPPDGS